MRSLFPRRQRRPAGRPGWRAYVVGDVHGRLDLLEQLLSKIEQELDQRAPQKALLAFVGDLIDRGPHSAQVVERLRTYSRAGVRTVFLLGNHEEVLLRILRGEKSLLASWLQFGGLACIESYGLDSSTVSSLSADELLRAVRKAVPKAHVDFIESFADTCKFGDYLFVHAGIRPGIDIDQQRQADLRWIREPFLSDESDHGVVVVHGHTIRPQVEVRPNRFGIDTGAYKTGILSALAIDAMGTWTLNTRLTENNPPRDEA